jgi:hypothetical protein
MRKLLVLLAVIVLAGCISCNYPPIPTETQDTPRAKLIAYLNATEPLGIAMKKIDVELADEYAEALETGDVTQLNQKIQELKAICKEIDYIHATAEAIVVHTDLSKSCSDTAESMAYISNWIQTGDSSMQRAALEKSDEALMLNRRAWTGWFQIIVDYGVTCDEVNYCEGD